MTPIGNPTLFLADWILPISAPPIPRGGLLTDDRGRIAAVGPRAEIEQPPGVQVVDLGRAALVPGLVNVHAHPDLAMFRGLLENLPFCGWIRRLLSIQRRMLHPEDYALAARWTAVEALRAGITTLAATEASGAAAGALREAGMRGIVYVETFGPDPTQAEGSVAVLRRAVERLREEESPEVRIGISPHAPFTISDDLFRAVARYARQEGIPVAIHAAESAAERALVTRGEGDFAEGLRERGIATPPRGRSTVEMLDRLGVLAVAPLLIHCVDLDAADVDRLAVEGCAVAHCPIANARLGHGIAPLVELQAAGVRVGLGTDSVGSNNRLDLLEEARVASLLQRSTRRSPDALPADELLRLCTLEGARALGLEHRIGTLEMGKDADLCAISLVGAHVRPMYDPATTLLHAAWSADVVLTAVRGRILYRDGRVLSLDEDALGRGMDVLGSRIADALA